MEIKQIIFLIVRLFGATLVTWLAATGNISTDQATNVIVGVAAFLVALIWSVANKVWFVKKIDTALQMPAHSSREDLKDKMEQIGKL